MCSAEAQTLKLKDEMKQKLGRGRKRKGERKKVGCGSRGRAKGLMPCRLTSCWNSHLSFPHLFSAQYGSGGQLRTITPQAPLEELRNLGKTGLLSHAPVQVTTVGSNRPTIQEMERAQHWKHFKMNRFLIIEEDSCHEFNDRATRFSVYLTIE